MPPYSAETLARTDDPPRPRQLTLALLSLPLAALPPEADLESSAEGAYWMPSARNFKGQLGSALMARRDQRLTMPPPNTTAITHHTGSWLVITLHESLGAVVPFGRILDVADGACSSPLGVGGGRLAAERALIVAIVAAFSLCRSLLLDARSCCDLLLDLLRSILLHVVAEGAQGISESARSWSNGGWLTHGRCSSV